MRVPVTALLVLLLAGCADPEQQDAAAAVRSLSQALQSDDAAAACRMLAPLTREELERSESRSCEQALPEQDLVQVAALGTVQRHGRQASVEVRGPDDEADTWFLSRFDDRWLLVAATCEPRGDRPYACELEGP